MLNVCSLARETDGWYFYHGLWLDRGTGFFLSPDG
jgi:hypothetical protein